MKNKSLFSIVKASLMSNKGLSAMFCFFVLISYLLIFLAVGIIVPLGVNIETRINNHIINREIIIDISHHVSEEECQRRLDEIGNIPEVIDIYEQPYHVSVNDVSGNIKGEYELGFIHRHYDITMVSGRAFDEDEKNVALVPAVIKDYDEAEGIIREIDGTALIGKTIRLRDMTENIRDYQVVGAYDTTDPIFNGKEILVSLSQLADYKKELTEEFPERYQGGWTYIVVTDSPRNTEDVYNQTTKITNSFRPRLNIDAETFNIAFILILASTVFFVLLTVFGFYMFLKGNVNARTNELALYRAMGFNSKNLFKIIAGEHMVLTLLSIILGAGVFYCITYFVVNPYLMSFLGSTYMEMTIDSNPLFGLAVAVVYVVITLSVTVTAVKRSEKIDLTVLLRE